MEKHALHRKWRIWDHLPFWSSGGMAYFPGVQANQNKGLLNWDVDHTY